MRISTLQPPKRTQEAHYTYLNINKQPHKATTHKQHPPHYKIVIFIYKKEPKRTKEKPQQEKETQKRRLKQPFLYKKKRKIIKKKKNMLSLQGIRCFHKTLSSLGYTFFANKDAQTEAF